MAKFTEIFEDVTKKGVKIPSNLYLDTGLYPIIDQGQSAIAGYTNKADGLFFDVPAIIFGDHTRIFKYVEKPCFLGADGVKLLKAKKPNANHKYLYYALCNADIPNTGYNRHFKWLKEVDIPEYSVEEQEDIVLKLDKISHLIALRKRQLSKLDELVKSRFVEMFGDPVSNPKKWNVCRIREFADVRIGPFGSLLHKEDYIQGGHPLVNPSHMINGKIVPDNDLTLSESKYKELGVYKLRPNDIVIARRGEIGRCALVESEGFFCGTGSMFVRIIKDCRADYLQRVISYPTFAARLEDAAVGITMKNINAGMIENCLVPLPPLALQREFAAFVEKVDKLEFKAKASLEKLKTLKKALMQKYFG